jgi:hypothetical protein
MLAGRKSKPMHIKQKLKYGTPVDAPRRERSNDAHGCAPLKKYPQKAILKKETKPGRF